MRRWISCQRAEAVAGTLGGHEHTATALPKQKVAQHHVPKWSKMGGLVLLPSTAATMASGFLMDRACVTTSVYVSGTGR